MRVALVHDDLNVFGGSERVLECLHDLFPDATVFTSVLDPALIPESWKSWKIVTSPMQRIPLARKYYRLILPLVILCFEQLDLSDYDLVISSSYCAAKSVICQPHTFHICYCHTPLRYAWMANPANLYSSKGGRLGKCALAAMMHWVRLWDYCSAARVDHFVANSYNIKARIKKCYGREASVVYPGIDISRFKVADDIGDYYLVLSRLVSHKRQDLAIKAANKLKRRLVVMGSGPEWKHLRKIAGPTVEFRGYVSDDEVADALSHCRALLFPGEEDFGLVPVEAQASGRPVVAYGRGGVRETVVDGVTGLLFYENTVDALCEAMVALESMSLCPAEARKNAERFSTEAFKQAFVSILDEVLANRPGEPPILLMDNTRDLVAGPRESA